LRKYFDKVIHETTTNIFVCRYSTSRTIAEDADQVFKCGFSVAPVIEWTYYHTHYTEKFMGLPFGDNEVTYN